MAPGQPSPDQRGERRRLYLFLDETFLLQKSAVPATMEGWLFLKDVVIDTVKTVGTPNCKQDPDGGMLCSNHATISTQERTIEFWEVWIPKKGVWIDAGRIVRQPDGCTIQFSGADPNSGRGGGTITGSWGCTNNVRAPASSNRGGSQ